MDDFECANPLLLKWVKEWLDHAQLHSTKGVNAYKKAYDSLKLCPIPYEHPARVQELQGFGEKLTHRLIKKMEEHCQENGLPMPPRFKGGNKRARSAEDGKDGDESEDEQSTWKKKPRTTKPYVPALRSGPYGLILALSTLHRNSTAGLLKDEVIYLAQPFCDSSYTVPSQSNKHYTGWSSMKTLTDKDLVYQKGRPMRYYLSEEGWAVATRIKQAHDSNQGRTGALNIAQSLEDSADCSVSPDRAPHYPDPSIPDIVPLGPLVLSVDELPQFSPIVLEPGSFTVELVLDNREVRAQKDRDFIQEELAKRGVKTTTRSLPLGDVLWIAKMNDLTLLSTKGAEGDEVLLDYIVERKRLDDLISSIKDGRFQEQKFRLRKSGIKNVIYIIEEFSLHSELAAKFEEHIQSAIVSTQVASGYFVKQTKELAATIRYLATMTKLLKEKYETKPLRLIPTKVLTTTNYPLLLVDLAKKDAGAEYHITYSAMCSMSSKSDSLTLRDVYLKMLMCTRGITGEKALEIQKKWKTPIELAEAIESGKYAVANELGNSVGRKKIGNALNLKLAEVWGTV